MQIQHTGLLRCVYIWNSVPLLNAFLQRIHIVYPRVNSISTSEDYISSFVLKEVGYCFDSEMAFFFSCSEKGNLQLSGQQNSFRNSKTFFLQQQDLLPLNQIFFNLLANSRVTIATRSEYLPKNQSNPKQWLLWYYVIIFKANFSLTTVLGLP